MNILKMLNLQTITSANNSIKSISSNRDDMARNYKDYATEVRNLIDHVHHYTPSVYEDDIDQAYLNIALACANDASSGYANHLSLSLHSKMVTTRESKLLSDPLIDLCLSFNSGATLGALVRHCYFSRIGNHSAVCLHRNDAYPCAQFDISFQASRLRRVKEEPLRMDGGTLMTNWGVSSFENILNWAAHLGKKNPNVIEQFKEKSELTDSPENRLNASLKLAGIDFVGFFFPE